MTPRSAIVCHAEVPADREATWPTSRRSTSRPSWTTWPSALDSSRVRGSWVEIARASRASRSTAGCHVHGVEGAGDAQRRSAAPWPADRRRARRAAPWCRRRRSGRCRCCWPGSRPARLERGQHLVAVAAEDGGHRRSAWRRTGGGHGPAALADEDHRLLGGEHADPGGRGDLADRVAGGDADQGRRRRGAGTARARRAGPARRAAAGRPRCRGWSRRRRRCRSARGRARRRRRASSGGRRSWIRPARAEESGVWAP